VLENEERPLPDSAPDHADHFGADGEENGLVRRVLPWFIWLSVVGFVVVGIGWPLLGQGVFGPTDLLARWSPYGETVLAGVVPRNTFLQDVADGVLPQTALFTDLLFNGGGAWNPFMVGGTPLGAVPNNAFLSPLSLPFYLLPTWFAPAWVKVLEVAVSVGGTFLFGRRLGLSRPAAFVGGLVFVTSAFMIAWTGWTQTRTAAFVPLLFWAVERLVQRRRVSDGVLVCLAVACMLFGGFPAITGYALTAAGIYFLIRVIAEYRTHWKRVTAVVAGGVAAIAGAAALAAIQLLPFSYFMSHAYVWGRDQTPADVVPFRSLITAIAPWALGSTDPLRPPAWFAGTNLVEAVSYVGAAALLLALVGVAAVRAGRSLLPRGVWVYLVAAIGICVVLIYAGGPPLAVAQKLPVLFADNFVGRVRSVLGFLIAVLAAVGFDLLLRRVREARRTGALRRVWGPLVWAGAAVGTAGLWYAGRRLADDGPGRVENFDRQVLIGLAFVGVAGLCVALAWWGRGRAVRTVALVGIPLLIAAQALTFAVPYWVRSDRDTFYPDTDVHRFLAENLGDGRYASPVDTLLPGESSIHQLRSLGGHAFSDKSMGELIEGLPGNQFKDPPTLPSIAEDPQIVESPILDRLAVRYYVSTPSSPVIGTPHDLATDATTTLDPDTPVTAKVQQNGPLRAVVAHVADPITAATRLEVSLRDPAGTEVASGFRNLRPTRYPIDLQIPVAGEDIPAGTPLTATIETTGGDGLAMAGQAGKPALATIGPAEDGLRVVMAEPTVVYERANALPRIRWAGTAVVEPDADRQLTMLADGDLQPGEVLLGAEEDTATDGAKATVDVTDDGASAIEATVDADGAGYLVVADALQNGWQATVDGERAELVPADHGVVAVAVDQGEHTVKLSYAAPYGGAGTWLSAATAVLLCALVVVERWWRRRQRTSTHTPESGTH
jgi:hypothetical protein